MRLIVLVTLGVLLFLADGTAQERTIVKSGFYKGNDYRRLEGDQKWTYLTGIVEGMLLAPVFGAPRSRVAWLEECIVGMTNEQIAAIVEKFLTENPGRWQEPMHFLAHQAMFDACKRPAK